MTTRSNSPYVPAFIRSVFTDAKPLQATYADFNLSDSNHESTGSFKYDPLGYPLKSTQQLNVDWSKFENHTFFGSAEVKVNEAFNKIINGYPFDGTKKEVEEFLDGLTGFEKWVFDSFPTWQGALHFSGTAAGEPGPGGTWISVLDKSGALFPDISKNNVGSTIVNPPAESSLSLEMLLDLPAKANSTQVVLQKASSSTNGFTFHLDPSVSTSYVTATFSVSSGSFRNSVSTQLSKGSHNHVCLVLNKDVEPQTLQFFLNEQLVATSAKAVDFGKLDIDNANLLIGSGTSFYSEGTLVVPTQTLSGSMDDLRVYHSARDAKSQLLNVSRGVYATSELKLYYRFNEPSGSLSLNDSYSIESIVLDSSGNSLHANINNFTASLRLDVSSDTVMTNEKKEYQKVLFPAYASVLDLNSRLLASASAYDRANPNIILKLVPHHYLLEGASQDGFSTVEGGGGDPYGGSGLPGQGEKGSVQIILSFLYMWAKFFDEMKTYVDAFATMRTVRYDTDETVPDNFLEDMVRYYGFYLPKFFTHATVEQLVEGQNVDGLTDVDTPLKRIQALLLRRILVNLPDVIRSKGTQHSIKSFLRSVGIDPENSLKIREYGGPTVRQLTTSRENRKEMGAMVDFSTGSLVLSTHLSGTRIEPGWPEPAGTFYTDPITGFNVGTTNRSDGLLTSGSWNVEAIFKMTPKKMGSIADPYGNQSLVRLITSGSASVASPALVANVVATQQDKYSATPATLQAFLRPAAGASAPVLHMSIDLSGAGIFDGDKWNVAIGCFRNDDVDSDVSSSYYLRAGKDDSGELVESYESTAFFQEDPLGAGNVLRQWSLGLNASGSQLAVGGGQSIPAGAFYQFLNDTVNVDDIARTTDYAGWMANLRFWSKGMTLDEWKEHARNPKSVGVADPKTNYNFVTRTSGSFGKLRLDVASKQATRTADSGGNIDLLDFSLNAGPTVGTGFPTGSKVLVGDYFSYSHLSPAFDEASTDDKIRIRSFEDMHLLNENPWAVPAPTYLSNDMFLQEEPEDDLRMSIEFSMVDSLDRDMVSMFSSFDVLNDALGRPELMFSPDYPDLEVLRDVYFNRLSGKPDFRRFLEFYRWFDASVSSFIEQLIPSKTLYKGSNFVVESHMLERHKTMARHSGNYLGSKQVIEDSLLVQQIVGKLRKY